MGWIEILKALQGIIKVEIKDIKFEPHIKLFSDNTINSPIQIDANKKEIGINIAELDDNQTVEVINLFTRDNGLPLVEKNAAAALEEFGQVETANEDILKFFGDILPPNDVEVLRIAFFLKERGNRGENIEMYKEDVIVKYGDRGRNILNLYSAGYFEDIFRPLYKTLDAEGKNYMFTKFYQKIVTRLPFVIFVNQRITAEELLSRIKNRFKYGMPFVNVHGIGSKNKKTIRSALEKLENEGYEGIEIEETPHVINVHLEKKKEN